MCIHINIYIYICNREIEREREREREREILTCPSAEEPAGISSSSASSRRVAIRPISLLQTSGMSDRNVKSTIVNDCS